MPLPSATFSRAGRIDRSSGLAPHSEHWILYLSLPGAKADSGQLSLYNAAYSSAGRGTVAYIDIPGSEGLTAVCTDNSDLADFITAFLVEDHDIAAAIIHSTAICPNGQPPSAALVPTH